MALFPWIVLRFAKYTQKKIYRDSIHAILIQQNLLKNLVEEAQCTKFGSDHQFTQIKNYSQFRNEVPIHDYESLRPYIELIKNGQENVLWKGKPNYFAKTSGTTSGIKYIPITKESIPNHINTARNAILCYIAEKNDASIIKGKMIFLSGSPILDKIKEILVGRLSGIVNHHIPTYLRKNQLPSFKTNCIEDWEKKVEAIVAETMNQDMRLISGIPPWMIMYFEKLMATSNKTVTDLFPNLKLIIHGGVNFQPYKNKLNQCLGKEIDTMELFPASEGFFAFQDSQTNDGLLLNINSGIFFEFIPIEDIGKINPIRLSLESVQLNTQYALIISNNAGLWAYNTGDTIKFVQLNPYKIRVTGRIKHFISAFGEHVIVEEVESAITSTAQQLSIKINEFTLAPIINDANNYSYHQWFIEFDEMPNDLQNFAEILDNIMRTKNIYYDDLIQGNILKPLQIKLVRKHGFNEYMQSIGKLGSQNKLPKLSNDRIIADALLKYTIN